MVPGAARSGLARMITINITSEPGRLTPNMIWYVITDRGGQAPADAME